MYLEGIQFWKNEITLFPGDPALAIVSQKAVDRINQLPRKDYDPRLDETHINPLEGHFVELIDGHTLTIALPGDLYTNRLLVLMAEIVRRTFFQDDRVPEALEKSSNLSGCGKSFESSQVHQHHDRKRDPKGNKYECEHCTLIHDRADHMLQHIMQFHTQGAKEQWAVHMEQAEGGITVMSAIHKWS